MHNRPRRSLTVAAGHRRRVWCADVSALSDACGLWQTLVKQIVTLQASLICSHPCFGHTYQCNMRHASLLGLACISWHGLLLSIYLSTGSCLTHIPNDQHNALQHIMTVSLYDREKYHSNLAAQGRATSHNGVCESPTYQLGCLMSNLSASIPAPYHVRRHYQLPKVQIACCRYSFDHGPVHFLQYSTEVDFAPGSPQHE